MAAACLAYVKVLGAVVRCRFVVPSPAAVVARIKLVVRIVRLVWIVVVRARSTHAHREQGVVIAEPNTADVAMGEWLTHATPNGVRASSRDMGGRLAIISPTLPIPSRPAPCRET